MEDSRCCGTGTCLIDATGRCWCGQQWNGQHMCRPSQDASAQPGSTSGTQEAPEANPEESSN